MAADQAHNICIHDVATTECMTMLNTFRFTSSFFVLYKDISNTLAMNLYGFRLLQNAMQEWESFHFFVKGDVTATVNQ